MFIAIDGPDGAGKTTLLQQVSRLLSRRHAVHLTAEPTHTPLGRDIRRILQSGTPEERKTLTELFLQDRRAHIEDEIRPALRAGQLVLCDRYKYATVVYQHIQGVPLDQLIAQNRHFLSPIMAFILTTTEAAPLLERISARGQAQDHFETDTFLQKTIELYAQMPDFFPSESFVYLDAVRSLETNAIIMAKIIDQIQSV